MKNIIISALSFCLCASVFSRPNVLILNLDDLGAAWLLPYTKKITPADVDSEAFAFFKKSNGKKDFQMEKCFELIRKGTPFIDSVASQGMVFNRCFATSNLCASSRMGLLTGRYQERWGVCDLDSAVANGTKKSNVPILAEQFKSAGYNCAAIGKWHVSRHNSELLQNARERKKAAGKVGQKSFQVRGKKVLIDDEFECAVSSAFSSCADGEFPTDSGFDYYFGYNLHESRYYCAGNLWENKSPLPQRKQGEFLTDLFNDKVCAYIEKSLKEKKPFMVYYAPMTMHGRLDIAPEKYGVDDMGMPQIARHVEHLRSIDEGLKSVFEVLKKYGQDKNTIVAICADNGSTYLLPPGNAPYRGGKGQGWIGGSRVPLIIYAPNSTAGYSDALVSLIDIFPTAMDYAKIKIPEGLDGETLKPIIDGKAKVSKRKNFYTEGLHAITWYPNFEWGFVKMSSQDANVCPMFAFNVSADNNVALVITPTSAKGYPNFDKDIPARKMLFDLNADPQQRENLIVKKADTYKEMQTSLNAWLKSLSTPVDTFKTKNKTSAFQELRSLTD